MGQDTSGVIKSIAGTLKGEIAQVQAGSQKLTAAATGMATGTTTGFGRMKAASGAFRADLAATSLAVAGVATAGLLMARSFIQAAAESEKASTRLRVAIRAAGQGVRQPELEGMAKNLQRIVPYSDEAIEGMMAFLASVKLNETQIKRLTPALLDLAEFMGRDVEGAAKLLGYALETGTTRGFARLKIVVDEAKFSLDPIGALIDAISAKCGGMAEAAGKDAGGQLEIFKNQVDELKEALGRGLLPALQTIVNVGTPAVQVLASLANSQVGKWAVAVAVPILGVAAAVKALHVAGLFVAQAATMIVGAYRAIGAAAGSTAAQVAAANATAVAAAGGGAVAAGAAGALPAAAGAAGAGLGLRAGLGLAARGVARFAGPAALAYIGYEAARAGIGAWQSRMDVRERELAQPNAALTARLFGPASPAARAREEQAALAERSAYLASLRPPAPASVAQVPSLPSGAGITDLRARVDNDRLVIDLGLDQTPPAGLLDDQTSAYLEDLAYAGEI
jgi:hypothetical protein